MYQEITSDAWHDTTIIWDKQKVKNKNIQTKWNTYKRSTNKQKSVAIINYQSIDECLFM